MLAQVTKNSAIQLIILFLFSALISMGLQQSVGDETIYSKELEAKRIIIHESMLNNTITENSSKGNVNVYGGPNLKGISTRIGTVYFADFINRNVNVPVLKVYKGIDTFFLWLSITALFFYLRLFVSKQNAMLGVLYFCSIIPLTYFFQLFHPWDRFSFFLWILLLICIEKNRLLMYSVLYLISIVVKFDTILLPALFFLRNIKSQPSKLFIMCAILGITGLFEFELINFAFPNGGFDEGNFISNALNQIAKNITVALKSFVGYPPMVVFFVPALLICFGWRNSFYNERLFFLFSLPLLVLMIILTNFIEVRAELPVLLLWLPLALRGMQTIFDEK